MGSLKEAMVQYAIIRARGDALSDFSLASSLIWVGDSKTNFEGSYGPVCKNPCTEGCDVEHLWVGDCKTNVGDILHSSPHVFFQRLRCRPDSRFVDLLTDGMVDFVLSLNSGSTVQYKHNAQFLRLFGLHGDVTDAHRAGANRLQTKQLWRNTWSDTLRVQVNT